MNDLMETLGNPKTDLFWIVVDKRWGDWVYTLRTESGFGAGMPDGAEVARFNPHHLATRGGEAYAKFLLKKLNA